LCEDVIELKVGGVKITLLVPNNIAHKLNVPLEPIKYLDLDIVDNNKNGS
jgi:hypothetical protein